MKLALNKRPEFVPEPGTALKDIEKAVLHLEACEQERKVSLHAELNRQIQLAKLNEEHTAKYEKWEWGGEGEGEGGGGERS
jgi:hypothetical protein